MTRSCQSCDLPFRGKSVDLGSEADGSASDRYCRYCYEHGKFLNPEITSATEMRRVVKQKLQEKGIPAFLAAFFTMRIPKLERWRATPR